MTSSIDLRQRQSRRLPDYDYSKPGAYFITVCTQGNYPLLGKVIDGRMILNEYGEIVEECWRSIAWHYPGVTLGEYVVMPNHFHGIVHIGAILELPLQKPVDSVDRLIRRQMLLPKLTGRFKMVSSKQINQLRQMPGKPVWQRNYYEHIIRNESAYNRIAEYVINNPLQWELDRYHTSEIL